MGEALTYRTDGPHEFYADPDGNHLGTAVEYEWHTKDAPGSGTPKMSLLNDGGLILTSIKSGATQVGAGAAANEIWKTASHASLPDNVLLIGV